MFSVRRAVVPLIVALLGLSGGLAWAQFRQDFFEGYRGLRGEQGDPAERPA